MTDFFVLGLPLPYIWKLNQSTSHKIMISGLFLLGGFVCIITIIRLVIQLHTDFASPDLTWSITDFVTWTNVEVSLAITSACLPSLRPIISYFKNGGKVTQANSAQGQYRRDVYGYGGRTKPSTLASLTPYGNHVRLDSRAPSQAGTNTDEYPLVDEPTVKDPIGRAQ